jgi:cytochrome P450
LLEAAAAATELAEYLEGIFAARRKEPRDDLISALVSVNERDDRLSENELLATVVLIMGAGHETTTNLIGNGMLALLRNPDQLELLRREPERASSAVDELLRYDSPVQVTSRRPKAEFELGGQLIAPDIEVVLYLGAGNHDPEIFPDPEVLNIQRDASKHLAFGQGVHFCLGAALAKIEGELAIGALVERFPGLKLASHDLEWRQGSVLRGVRQLPLRF